MRKLEAITEKIIGICIDIHRELGPGLLESAYEECVAFELANEGLEFERQKPLPVIYKGLKLDCAFRLDFVVEKSVILELKAVQELLPVHKAQVLTYLKLSKIEVGLLVNFHCATLKEGLRRIVLNYQDTKNSLSASPRLGG